MDIEAGGIRSRTRVEYAMTEPPCVDECTRCQALVQSRTQIVNGDGPVDAALMLVGEAPGQREDEAGVPFVGRSGTLLDEALANHGLDRSDVRITNCVRCRPPDNRDPHVGERTNCRSYLEAELAAVDPAVVLPLGRVPAQELLDRDVQVTSEAGEIQQRDLGGKRRTVVIGLHPAAILYDRSKRDPFETSLTRALKRAGLA